MTNPITPVPLWERTRRPLWVRLVNAVGGAFRGVGLKVPRLDAEAILNRAMRRSGLADFGDPDFRQGLDVLIAAFESKDDAHTFGRLFFREFCTTLLVNRLKIQESLTRHPEILGVSVRRPLIVTGLPRSGTTFLHRLMSENPEARPLLMWETLEPAPPPRTATHATDSRIARAERSIKLIHWLAPGVDAAHEFHAESPEETNNLFAHAFVSEVFGFLFDVPEYLDWLEYQNVFKAYQYMRQQLQLLSWKCPGGGRWVLKAPSFLYNLDALLAAFPDACIVQTHRDPTKVMPSLCSLATAMRGMTTNRVDLERLGVELTGAIPKAVNRAINIRAVADPSRFFDVSYEAMIADPIGTLSNISESFGDRFDAEYEARARRWLSENPQHKHGVHRYHLEDFGLDATTVNEAFALYRAWVRENVPEATFSA